jgi:exodeoxyribonuclease VII small subunit
LKKEEKKKMAKKTVESYSAAMTELQEILSLLENDEIGVDELVEKVERASHLLKWCDRKLRETETKIQKIIGEEGE